MLRRFLSLGILLLTLACTSACGGDSQPKASPRTTPDPDGYTVPKPAGKAG